MTIADPRRVSASPGSLRPVAFNTCCVSDAGVGGREVITEGNVVVVVPLPFTVIVPPPKEADDENDSPKSPDTALHAVLTILPGDAIAAAPMVASGSSVSMSLDMPVVDAGAASIVCAATSA